jgi:hypothetical protein
VLVFTSKSAQNQVLTVNFRTVAVGEPTAWSGICFPETRRPSRDSACAPDLGAYPELPQEKENIVSKCTKIWTAALLLWGGALVALPARGADPK